MFLFYFILSIYHQSAILTLYFSPKMASESCRNFGFINFNLAAEINILSLLLYNSDKAKRHENQRVTVLMFGMFNQVSSEQAL